MSKIALITTSTRPNRIGHHVTAWVRSVLESSNASSDVSLTTVDASTFNLPLFNDTVLPAMAPTPNSLTSPQGTAWSAEISKYDGYILFANEYNFGMSAATKNAVDWLYHAWIGKPIMIVSYGIMGGASASEQLKGCLTGMHLRVVETRPQLGFEGGPKGEDMGRAIGGVLGEGSVALWEREKREEVLKGFGELKELLKEKPVEKGEKAEA